MKGDTRVVRTTDEKVDFALDLLEEEYGIEYYAGEYEVMDDDDDQFLVVLETAHPIDGEYEFRVTLERLPDSDLWEVV